MKSGVERRLIAGLGIVLMLIVLIGSYSYRITTHLLDYADHVSGPLSVRNKAVDVLATMDDLETGMRGYVITGNERNLEPYFNSLTQGQKRSDELFELLAKDPGDARDAVELKQLIANERTAAQNAVNLRRSEGFERAAQWVAGGEGKRLMDRIRQIIRNIVAAQDRVIAQQDQQGRQTRHDVQRTLWIIGAGCVFGVALLAVASHFIIKQEYRHRLIDEQYRQNLENYRVMVDGAKDYAIFMLDNEGRIRTSNAGSQRIKGYTPEEIIGKSFRCFYTDEDLQDAKPERELKIAREEGKFEEDGWRVRKDGSRFWANVVIQPLHDSQGRPIGFSKITRDLTERKRAEEALQDLNETLQGRTRDLEVANQELEAFCYSVSHDLRTPLRSIDGFSQNLLEDYTDRLDDEGKDSLNRVRAASQRMGRLIDDLLSLSKVSRAGLKREKFDLGSLAEEVAAELRTGAPERNVEFVIAPNMVVNADKALLRIVLSNLIGNAWKFTSKCPVAHIEFGSAAVDGKTTYFVSDNGAGFDMTYASKLFGAFQRLHNSEEFPGTGIGLATVQRIINRHGGSIWATAKTREGAKFSFAL
jgi:PAS domain S-box-containing protein